MASDNQEHFISDSDSDSDSGFNEDMEALRRACHLTGSNHVNLRPSTTSLPSSSAAAAAAASTSATSHESEDDDFELLRCIERRFSVPSTAEPLSLKPLCALPPVEVDNDYENDLETLRAIQRRFSHYNDCVSSSTEGSLQKHEQVGATNIDLEKESSNNLFLERTNNGEGFPDCVDASDTQQNVNPSCNSELEMPPSDSIELNRSLRDTIAASPVRGSSFPVAAQAFVAVIKKNRMCQDFIRKKLGQIEARIEENNKLRAHVKILKDFQVACRRRVGRALSQKKDARVELISVRKLRANAKTSDKKLPAIYHGPAENAHVANYRLVLSRYPHSLRREKWSKEEKENIEKGIKQQFQNTLLQKSMDLYSNGTGDSNSLDSIVASIRDHDIRPDNIRSFLPKVNWDNLASMYVVGRTGAECEARWLNCDDPLINHDRWSKLEDKNLLHIVSQRGLSNWMEIAVLLGTNRTPFQCLARYQRSLNAAILKREWTEDEDSQLRAAVAACGESNWQLVASMLEGRTGTQCSNRWKKTLNPIRQRVGKWAPDEDKRLKIAVMLFGAKNWNKIAQFVPGRTQVQCRERWVNCLDPSLNLNAWTEEEDLRLKAAIEEHGYSWSKIAACISPRTDSQCRRRWKVLFPDDVPLLRAARRTQKTALISNFVDREQERPSLGPNDFVSPLMIEASEKSSNVNHSRRKKRKLRSTPVDIGSDSPSRNVPENRCKRPRKKSCIPSDEVLRSTNGEVENIGAAVAKKKRVKNKPRSKNVERAGAFGWDPVKTRKRVPKRQKRKSRGLGERPEKDAPPEPNEILKVNLHARDDETLGPTPIEFTESIFEENQVIPELINDTQPIQDNSSSPFNTSEANIEAGMNERSGIMNENGLKHCSSNNSPTASIGSDLNAEESTPRCLTPDVIDSRPLGETRPSRPKNGLSSRGRARLKQVEDKEDEEDITLASFLKQSKKRQARSTNSVTAGASSQTKIRGSKVRNRSRKGDISEHQEEDATTLACLFSEFQHQEEDATTLACLFSELKKKRNAQKR